MAVLMDALSLVVVVVAMAGRGSHAEMIVVVDLLLQRRNLSIILLQD